MYAKNPKGWIKHIDFILLDILCMIAAYQIAFAARMNALMDDKMYGSLMIPILLIDALACILFSEYSDVLKRDAIEEMKKTFFHALKVAIGVIIYLFLQHINIGSYSRQVFITMPFIYMFLSYILRLFWKRRVIRFVQKQRNKSLIVITSFDEAAELINNIIHTDYHQYLIQGIISMDNGHDGETICDIPVLTSIDNTVEYLSREWVDEVLISMPANYPISETLLEKLNQMGIVVHINLNSKIGDTKMEQNIGRIGGNCVLTYSVRTVEFKQIVKKRILDIAGGLIGCFCAGILIIILGPIIYFTDKGPIFFQQTRIGKNGKRFKIAKFRSMYMDAEERKSELMAKNKVSDERLFKLDEDPRILGSKILPDGTYKKGIGNFIRDFSLDEFPQFWNVLIGQMSLVGTRPPVEREWVLYTPENRGRMAVKPGITGLWQVSGRSNITDFDEVVKLDSEYINTWTIKTDIMIILKTVKVVLKRDGAV